MTRKFKAIAILACMFLISVLFITVTPIVSAKNEVKDGTTQIFEKGTYKITIEKGEGNIEFEWNITEYDEDKVYFYIEDEDETRFDKTRDQGNHSNITLIEEGKYTFVWLNNNIKGSFEVSYIIKYPEPSNEESTGCYSFIILITLISIVLVIWTFSYTIKKK